MSNNKSCETCIENNEYICIYKCYKHSHWKGCPNNYQCRPITCNLYNKDCSKGKTKLIDCQG